MFSQARMFELKIKVGRRRNLTFLQRKENFHDVQNFAKQT